MQRYDPLVQFDQEEKTHDDDEPLLKLDSQQNQDDSQPLEQLQPKETAQNVGAVHDGDDDEPMVQLHFKDYDDDSSPMKDMTTTVRVKIGYCTKIACIVLGVVTAVATLIALLALIISAAGLQKTVVTTSTVTASTHSATVIPTTHTIPTKPPTLVTVSNCGSGLWKRVAYLNMNNASEECPHAWRGYDSPVRCCGRPVSARSSQPSVYYSTDGFQYRSVCGKIIGYQVGSPDCFHIRSSEPETEIVNGLYVDGVSVTHGNPRSHIWTFAVGLHEFGGVANDQFNCPCDGGNNPPQFVGNSYFCETGDDTPNVELRTFYNQDPLWDGKNCNNGTCCTFNSPPWFKVQLPQPTMDDIEIRICGDQGTADEDTPISLIEIYVQ